MESSCNRGFCKNCSSRLGLHALHHWAPIKIKLVLECSISFDIMSIHSCSLENEVWKQELVTKERQIVDNKKTNILFMVLVILFVINFLLYLTTSFSCLMIRWGQRYKKSSFTIVNALKFFSRGEKWTSRIKKRKKYLWNEKFLLFLQCCYAIQRRHVKLPATTILVISITITHIIVYFGVGF